MRTRGDSPLLPPIASTSSQHLPPPFSLSSSPNPPQSSTQLPRASTAAAASNDTEWYSISQRSFSGSGEGMVRLEKGREGEGRVRWGRREGKGRGDARPVLRRGGWRRDDRAILCLSVRSGLRGNGSRWKRHRLGSARSMANQPRKGRPGARGQPWQPRGGVQPCRALARSRSQLRGRGRAEISAGCAMGGGGVEVAVGVGWEEPPRWGWVWNGRR